MLGLPNLKDLNVSNNLLEDIPADLSDLETLRVHSNPLSKILYEYRQHDKVRQLELFVVFDLLTSI